jgi:hypothetical protein
METVLHEPQQISPAQAPRGIAHRTFGHRRGPITRLVSPSGTGETIKPFVFLDRAEVQYAGKPLFGIHPLSGIATLTVVLAGTKDPTNPLAAYGIKAVDLAGRHSSSVVRELVPGARLVKGLNHLPVTVLPEPAASGGQRVLFYAGDDADARAAVRRLIEKIGFYPVDLGTLDTGAPLISVPSGPLANVGFLKI